MYRELDVFHLQWVLWRSCGGIHFKLSVDGGTLDGDSLTVTEMVVGSRGGLSV